MKDVNTPLSINSKITLKNRVILPPMASQTADSRGFVTENTIAHYKDLSKSNTSLMMVEHTFIHQLGKSDPFQLGISQDEHIPGLTVLNQTIKNSGAVSAIQLNHGGGKSSRQITGGKLLSPSGITVPTRDKTLETPDIITDVEITELINAYVLAAKRAHIAGFDIIEIHAAHGYGINQWLSPITNQRQDEYGGSIKNRARLLFEIINEILLHIPGATLSVRIPGMDHMENGLSANESIYLAKALEKIGVSIINVSSGIGGWQRPRSRTGEGYLVDDAKVIQSHISIPVIGVGGIKSREYINESLQRNHFSLAAVGRAILENPFWGISIGLT